MTRPDARIEYTPFPAQVRAHQATQKNILYGGAVGGGKTVAIVNDALRQALAYEGNRVGIFRWELSSFKKTTYPTLELWVLGVPGLVVNHNQAEYTVDLVNGSRIVYGGLKPSSSVAGDLLSVVKSLELNALYIDEVTDVPERLFDFACTRVPRVRCRDPRTGEVSYPPARVFCTCNPELGWVKSRFIDRQLRNHLFIPSRVYDNYWLDDAYEQDMRDQWANQPDWVARYLEGDWTAAVDYAALFIAPWLAAATRRAVLPGQPCELGVDVAAGGQDLSVVVRRRGMLADVLMAERGLPDTMTTVQKVAGLIDRHRPQVTKIDAIGVGKGVYDRLAELGYNVQAMIGGATADDEQFANKRAEWYWGVRVLLERGVIGLPDEQAMMNELGQIRFATSASDRTIKVEGKADIVKRLGHSPDYADALVYAFAEGGGLSAGVTSAIVRV